MSSFTIGQLANRAGVTTSALRYYERCGVLEPVGRNGAGYRLYDETSEARLSFIGRSKRLGCTLEEIVDLVGLLDQDRCQPVQARLHELVTDKLAAAERRADELDLLTAQLREAATQLDREPLDGPCDEGCACHIEPGRRPAPSAPAVQAVGPQPVVFGRTDDVAIACTLDADSVPDRIDAWRTLLGFVVDRQPINDGLGLRLGLDPTVPTDELLRLTTAEQECCAFFSFAITIDRRGVALEVQAPEGAGDVLARLFGHGQAPLPS